MHVFEEWSNKICDYFNICNHRGINHMLKTVWIKTMWGKVIFLTVKKQAKMLLQIHAVTWDKAASRSSITAFISSAVILFLHSLVL